MPCVHALHMHMMYIRVHAANSHMCYLLSPDSPEMFNVSVLPAVNSPLDVYFLFDVSASLSDDIRFFIQLIEDISMSLSVFKNCMYIVHVLRHFSVHNIIIYII